ncbi:MAG: TetR/AcrR family transcriptional regulator [Pyrinomonadaceae bacterium]
MTNTTTARARKNITAKAIKPQVSSPVAPARHKGGGVSEPQNPEAKNNSTNNSRNNSRNNGKLVNLNGNELRMGGDARRDQILQVAMRLFSQRGFRGTTTKEIANAAGISEAMIFRHFKNKRDLYSAILDHACHVYEEAAIKQEILEAAERNNDDRIFFERLAFAILKRSEKAFDFTRLLLFSALERHELSEMFFEKYVPEKMNFIVKYIRRRQEQGYMRKIGHQSEEGLAFIGMIQNFLYIKHLFDADRKLVKMTNKEASEMFAEIFLYGVATTRPAENPAENKAPVRKRSLYQTASNNGTKVKSRKVK